VRYSHKLKLVPYVIAKEHPNGSKQSRLGLLRAIGGSLVSPEISQDVVDALTRTFFAGEGQYDFDDGLISVEILAALMEAQTAFDRHFAQSA
jgi:hypothetical protein